MRGGYRPGAGRKRGQKDTKPRKGTKPKPKPSDRDKIREMLSFGVRAKAKIYQEYLQRLSQGGKLSVTEKRHMDKIGAELELEIKVEPGITENAAAENMTPLEYMLKVMNDPQAEKDRRDKMAIAAAPFIHPRKGEGNAKDDKADRAKAAAAGKYAPGKAPLKVVK